MNMLNYAGIEVSVTVNSRPVRTYPHKGKYFFESRKDSQYEIVVKNNNYHRVEVIVSVDGLSVMNGELASKSDSGYIVNGYDKVVIKGYRYSDDSVGAFKFTDKSGSYAASKKAAGNAGLIAIVVFAEAVKWQPAAVPYWQKDNFNSTPWPPYWWNSITYGGFSQSRNSSTIGGCLGSNGPKGELGTAGTNGINCSSTVNYCSTLRSPACPGVTVQETDCSVSAAHGTGWGDKLDDHVNYVSWERGYEMYSTEIQYNSRENLIAMGVSVVPQKLAVKPVGFPRDHARPPRGWNG